MSDKRWIRWEDETDSDRARSVRRGYRDGLTPPADIQALFPIEKFPCPRCAGGDLPYLVDHGGSEYSWEHRGARYGCSRFGTATRGLCGERPRKGTATSLWLRPSTGVLPAGVGDPDDHRPYSSTRPKTPEQYAAAVAHRLGEMHRDLLEYAWEGKTAEELSAILGYTPEEVRTIVWKEQKVHDHYNHPNYDQEKSLEAIMAGVRYDPAEGWDG